MNYATWQLNFDNPDYGTGAEVAIAEQGVTAEAAWSNGQVHEGATILGYLTAEVDESLLTDWKVKNLSQAEALSFCQSINPDATLTTEGRIALASFDWKA
jgi:hypothetical protein